MHIPAHPRSRGENSATTAMIAFVGGSSPLTRGKQRKDDKDIPARRLIPAHAGKTEDGSRGFGCLAAHPRSRGENAVALRSGTTRRGSSPLTRGKRPHPAAGIPQGRLIPAHAGKTRRDRYAYHA